MTRLISWISLFAAAAMLTAGCGTTAAPAGGGASPTATRAASSPPAGRATPAPTTTGVPVTPGGPVNPGGPVAPGPGCTGWPGDTIHGSALPASFVPVAVLRCVIGYQQVPGKGRRATATLERADKHLGPLIAALRRPAPFRTRGKFCPQLVMLPPQVMLVGKDGTAVWPRLPVTGCGQVQEQVLAALAGLPWKPVSVRLIPQAQPGQ